MTLRVYIDPETDEPHIHGHDVSASQIRYTYEGDEVLTLAGRSIKAHRVREDPVGSATGVFTIWWYDDQGMGVKRFHKATQGEYTEVLVAWREHMYGRQASRRPGHFRRTHV